ncbi:MAG TPA: heme o synthase [Rhabdochlamydiaceae bacterium]|nr:heme o synthase [Rhabdochlamydiaceae bacterium]
MNTKALSLPKFKDYCLLTKPGIIFGNIITMAGGFALASKQGGESVSFLGAALGLSLMIASACVFNNYIDRALDQKMERTKKRALAAGSIPGPQALMFAVALGLLAIFFLFAFTNLLALSAALLGFAIYVGVYSFLKHRDSSATLVGSIAGAMPPLVGYTAKLNHLDSGAFFIFLIVALWQMPHFFAIALYRMDEYAAAKVPTLPIEKGVQHTKIQMFLYILAFIAALMLLPFFKYTGTLYLIGSSILSVSWLLLCIKGLKEQNYKLWARQMFLFSLVVIMGISALVSF